MARDKLITFKKYLQNYLLIPYALNIYRDGNLLSTATGGAKLDYSEINKITGNFKNLYQKYFFQKKSKIGIDCSGLCFHLLVSFAHIFHNIDLSNKLKSIDGALGVRKLNSANLVNSHNSHPITFSRLKLGDLILTNNHKHILFVLENNNGIIKYIHSSRHSNIHGVFVGYLIKSQSSYTFSDLDIHTPNFFSSNYFSSVNSS